MVMIEDSLFILGFVVILCIVIFILIYRVKRYSNEHESNKKFRSTELRYTELVRLLPQTVVELDTNGRITFLNDFGLDFLSLNSFQLDKEVYLKDFIVIDQQERFYQDFLYIQEGGLNKGQEYLLKLRNNTFNPIMIYFSSIIRSDETIGVRGIVIDMARVKDLERKAFQAVVDTEEKERKRYSEDLHDGLGPLLSTVKLYLNQLDSTAITDDERIELRNFTNKLIDEAISTTRTIANNILPSSIADNGLWSAIQTFCAKVERTGSIKFQLLNKTNIVFGTKAGNTIYRMVIELINNTIKHANANVIELSFEYDNEFFSLSYSDNGVGIEGEISEGLGMDNIRNRSAALNGQFRFYNSNGLRFNLLIPINELEK